jgi:hypothetical protein
MRFYSTLLDFMMKLNHISWRKPEISWYIFFLSFKLPISTTYSFSFLITWNKLPSCCLCHLSLSLLFSHSLVTSLHSLVTISCLITFPSVTLIIPCDFKKWSQLGLPFTPLPHLQSVSTAPPSFPWHTFNLITKNNLSTSLFLHSQCSFMSTRSPI